MSIKKLIENPLQEKEIRVEYQGETYVVRGKPTAAAFAKASGRDLGTDLQSVANHLSFISGAEVSPQDAYQINLVSAFLVDDDGVAGTVDVSDVCQIWNGHPMLFQQLLAGCYDIGGITAGKSNPHGPHDAVGAAALGESQSSGRTGRSKPASSGTLESQAESSN